MTATGAERQDRVTIVLEGGLPGESHVFEVASCGGARRCLSQLDP